MRKSRVSSYKQERLLEMFISGATARTAADLVGVHRNTAAYYFPRLRMIILDAVEQQSLFDGEVELDESYFGGHRKGKRGRGAAGKVPVFGILKRGDKVYTKVISDTKSKTLLPIIEAKICLDYIVYTDSYSSYDVLDVSAFRHYRVNHSPISLMKKIVKIILMGLRIFGAKPSVICANSMVFLKPILSYI